jgi:hypothetical protein
MCHFLKKLYFPVSSEDPALIGSSNDPVIFCFNGGDFVMQKQ